MKKLTIYILLIFTTIIFIKTSQNPSKEVYLEQPIYNPYSDAVSSHYYVEEGKNWTFSLHLPRYNNTHTYKFLMDEGDSAFINSIVTFSVYGDRPPVNWIARVNYTGYIVGGNVYLKVSREDMVEYEGISSHPPKSFSQNNRYFTDEDVFLDRYPKETSESQPPVPLWVKNNDGIESITISRRAVDGGGYVSGVVKMVSGSTILRATLTRTATFKVIYSIGGGGGGSRKILHVKSTPISLVPIEYKISSDEWSSYGKTPFDIVRNQQFELEYLTAPSTSKNHRFKYWILDGVKYYSNTIRKIKVDRERTAVAVYQYGDTVLEVLARKNGEDINIPVIYSGTFNGIKSTPFKLVSTDTIREHICAEEIEGYDVKINVYMNGKYTYTAPNPVEIVVPDENYCKIIIEYEEKKPTKINVIARLESGERINVSFNYIFNSYFGDMVGINYTDYTFDFTDLNKIVTISPSKNEWMPYKCGLEEIGGRIRLRAVSNLGTYHYAYTNKKVFGRLRIAIQDYTFQLPDSNKPYMFFGSIYNRISIPRISGDIYLLKDINSISKIFIGLYAREYGINIMEWGRVSIVCGVAPRINIGILKIYPQKYIIIDGKLYMLKNVLNANYDPVNGVATINVIGYSEKSIEIVYRKVKEKSNDVIILTELYDGTIISTELNYSLHGETISTYTPYIIKNFNILYRNYILNKYRWTAINAWIRYVNNGINVYYKGRWPLYGGFGIYYRDLVLNGPLNITLYLKCYPAFGTKVSAVLYDGSLNIIDSATLSIGEQQVILNLPENRSAYIGFKARGESFTIYSPKIVKAVIPRGYRVDTLSLKLPENITINGIEYSLNKWIGVDSYNNNEAYLTLVSGQSYKVIGIYGSGQMENMVYGNITPLLPLQWIPVNINLSEYAGQNLTLTFLVKNIYNVDELNFFPIYLVYNNMSKIDILNKTFKINYHLKSGNLVFPRNDTIIGLQAWSLKDIEENYQYLSKIFLRNGSTLAVYWLNINISNSNNTFLLYYRQILVITIPSINISIHHLEYNVTLHVNLYYRYLPPGELNLSLGKIYQDLAVYIEDLDRWFRVDNGVGNISIDYIYLYDRLGLEERNISMKIYWFDEKVDRPIIAIPYSDVKNVRYIGLKAYTDGIGNNPVKIICRAIDWNGNTVPYSIFNIYLDKLLVKSIKSDASGTIYWTSNRSAKNIRINIIPPSNLQTLYNPYPWGTIDLEG